jgi:hypothetical protein
MRCGQAVCVEAGMIALREGLKTINRSFPPPPSPLTHTNECGARRIVYLRSRRSNEQEEERPILLCLTRIPSPSLPSSFPPIPSLRHLVRF